MKTVGENKSDNDQGYCSFGERKDESPEDDSARKSRSSTWRGSGKRSMSVISNASDESNSKPVIRRKNELALGSRNTDTRKSYVNFYHFRFLGTFTGSVVFTRILTKT